MERVDLRKLRRCILDGKLVPCYVGKEEAPSQQELEECPICFLNYPVLNTSNCCTKRVCTECYLQVQTMAVREASTACPFCKAQRYCVTFTGPRTAADKDAERCEDQKLIEARIREREEEMQRDQARELQRIQQAQERAAAAAVTAAASPPRAFGSPVVGSPAVGSRVVTAFPMTATTAAASTAGASPQGSAQHAHSTSGPHATPHVLAGGLHAVAAHAANAATISGGGAHGTAVGSPAFGSEVVIPVSRREATGGRARNQQVTDSTSPPSSSRAGGQNRSQSSSTPPDSAVDLGSVPVFLPSGQITSGARPGGSTGQLPSSISSGSSSHATVSNGEHARRAAVLAAAQASLNHHRQNRHNRDANSAGNAARGQKYQVADYVPPSVVDIAVSVEDMNDFMLEQAMYNSLVAEATAASLASHAAGRGGTLPAIPSHSNLSSAVMDSTGSAYTPEGSGGASVTTTASSAPSSAVQDANVSRTNRTDASAASTPTKHTNGETVFQVLQGELANLTSFMSSILEANGVRMPGGGGSSGVGGSNGASGGGAPLPTGAATASATASATAVTPATPPAAEARGDNPCRRCGPGPVAESVAPGILVASESVGGDGAHLWSAAEDPAVVNVLDSMSNGCASVAVAAAAKGVLAFPPWHVCSTLKQQHQRAALQQQWLQEQQAAAEAVPASGAAENKACTEHASSAAYLAVDRGLVAQLAMQGRPAPLRIHLCMVQLQMSPPCPFYGRSCSGCSGCTPQSSDTSYVPAMDGSVQDPGSGSNGSGPSAGSSAAAGSLVHWAGTAGSSAARPHLSAPSFGPAAALLENPDGSLQYIVATSQPAADAGAGAQQPRLSARGIDRTIAASAGATASSATVAALAAAAAAEAEADRVLQRYEETIANERYYDGDVSLDQYESDFDRRMQLAMAAADAQVAASIAAHDALHKATLTNSSADARLRQALAAGDAAVRAAMTAGRSA